MTEILTNNEVLAQHVDLADRDVVDVGCGAGGLVRWMRARGAKSIGVECGEIMLQRALDADPGHADTYIDAVGEDLPFDDASMNAVTFIYSLHHVPANAMMTALSEAHRILQPGGVAFITEPIPDGPGQKVARLVDDETKVRGLAQAALAKVEDVGFVRQKRGEYTTQTVFADFEAYAALVVGVDPARAETMASNREAVEEAFLTNGEMVAGGYRFEQRCVFDLLLKPAT